MVRTKCASISQYRGARVDCQAKPHRQTQTMISLIGGYSDLYSTKHSGSTSSARASPVERQHQHLAKKHIRPLL